MPDQALLDRISVDPAVCGGKPCIRGHRIWVAILLDLLADGMSVAEVLAEFPSSRMPTFAQLWPTQRRCPWAASSS